MRMVVCCLDGCGMTRCPCRKCANQYYDHINMVENHLYQNRIDLSYTQWIFHGEDPFTTNNIHVEHTPNNASVEDLDELEDLLNDVHRGTFLVPNIGDSSTTQE
jgi:hypothetical protein